MKLPKLLVQGVADGDNSRKMQTCDAKCLWCCDLERHLSGFHSSLNKEANCVCWKVCHRVFSQTRFTTASIRHVQPAAL